MRHIYLDHNATTPLLPAAAEAMARWSAGDLGNPASPHWAGRRSRQALEEAHDSIAAILGAQCHSSRADQVVFTSGGTEANNLAVFGLAGTQPGHIVSSGIEHPSVAGAVTRLRTLGWEVDFLPTRLDGVAEVAALADLLRAETRLVALMLGNNETGVLQDVAAAARLCATRGVPLHTDAVQVVGKLPVDFRALGVTTMTISAHKFQGPVAAGALIVRHGTQLAPQTHGGFQQQGLRPGTESVALAIGMATALSHAARVQAATCDHMTRLRERFESGLKSGWPDLVVNGSAAPRLPHTSNVAFPGLDRQALVIALDLAEVACSTGSACASGSSEPSPTLLAMGCPRAVFEGSLRFSLGASTEVDEVDEAVSRILKVCNGLRTANSRTKLPAAGTVGGANLIE